MSPLNRHLFLRTAVLRRWGWWGGERPVRSKCISQTPSSPASPSGKSDLRSPEKENHTLPSLLFVTAGIHLEVTATNLLTARVQVCVPPAHQNSTCPDATLPSNTKLHTVAEPTPSWVSVDLHAHTQSCSECREKSAAPAWFKYLSLLLAAGEGEKSRWNKRRRKLTGTSNCSGFLLWTFLQ